MSRMPAIGITHVPMPETLAELETLICQRLGGRLRNFRLSIRDAGLVLSGKTRSHYARQLAQHALMDMTQAPITANEIEVCDPPGLATLDESMSARAAVEFLPPTPTPPRTIGR